MKLHAVIHLTCIESGRGMLNINECRREETARVERKSTTHKQTNKTKPLKFKFRYNKLPINK